MRTMLLAGLLLAGLAACSNAPESSMAGGAAPAAMMALPEAAHDKDAQEGALLAYEHHAEIRIAAADIVPRMQAAQAACNEARFGQCVVLDVRQTGGDFPSATLGMRMAPAAVEPMIALASAGAELGSRSTQAEDLAVVVRDNDQVRARLRKELERLQQFQQRGDLAVADMIALSKQIAETEAQLEAADQEAAQHRRRIDTQRLTLEFQPPAGQAGRSEIGQALRDFGAILSAGAAWTIRALAFLIPVAVLVVLLVLLVRWLRRRRRAHQPR